MSPKRQTTRVRIQHLTVFLMREEVEEYETALKDEALDAQPLRSDLPFEGVVYFRTAPFRVPRWVSFVESGTADNLGALATTNNSAVLFVRASDRIFAFTFGHGHTMLDPASFERDFGLKVTLNAVDPEKLRSVDASTIEEMVLRTRRQTSRRSPLETFGLDVTTDLLRAVVGDPQDPAVARHLAGADPLRMAVAIEFDQLAAKCSELLRIHGLDTYKDRFSWIDHLQAIRDPSLIERLDELLPGAVTGPRESQPHLAPPQTFDWEGWEGFYYPTDDLDGEPRVDLDLDDYVLSLGDEEVAVGLLRRDHVFVRYASAGAALPEWSIYNCLVWQTLLDEQLYVITEGRWFLVDRDFAASVRTRVSMLPTALLDLPEPEVDESEGDYNVRAAGLGVGVLLDKKLARAAGAGSSIEFCDLMTLDRQLIHVKWWSKSATLSHLFAQGTVSAETFLRDEVFRENVREALAGQSAEAATSIPEGRPNAPDFEVDYVILGKQGVEWLPFFSQLTMLNACERLQLLGFKIGTKLIPAAPGSG
jgi:uncharacterized protein (TIGR04141 family)